MPRPVKCRWVWFQPGFTYFKPRGIPMRQLEEEVLTIVEFEALRLADLEELSQEAAATRMRISRPTFGRIIKRARNRVTSALVNGKAIRISGGNYLMVQRVFLCHFCGNRWGTPYGAGRLVRCPQCGNFNVSLIAVRNLPGGRQEGKEV